MSTPDDDALAALKPFLDAGGLDADRFAPLGGDPKEEHRRLAALIATFPERRPDEDSQDWWARAMAARTAAAQAARESQFGPGVVSLEAWKARAGRTATLVRRTAGSLSYGDDRTAGRPHPLPDRAILTDDQFLEVYYEAADGAITVTLETVTVFALEEYGSGRPYLVSLGVPGRQTPIVPEGGPVFFSDDGIASFTLPDTPEVRARLGYVIVDEVR